MSEPSKEDKVITVLLERFEKQRLPRALSIKEKVDAGEPLDNLDTVFLDELLEDIGDVKPVVDHRPDLQAMYARVVHLYHEITAKALENEEAGET